MNPMSAFYSWLYLKMFRTHQHQHKWTLPTRMTLHERNTESDNLLHASQPIPFIDNQDIQIAKVDRSKTPYRRCLDSLFHIYLSLLLYGRHNQTPQTPVVLNELNNTKTLPGPSRSHYPDCSPLSEIASNLAFSPFCS